MDLEKEQIAISMQLQEMQMGGGMSIWPKHILHPSRPPCDTTNMIIIKACGLCKSWYHCYDIVVTSCLHTYHLTCLGEHLKTNNNCKVCTTNNYTLIGGQVGVLGHLTRISFLQQRRWAWNKNRSKC